MRATRFPVLVLMFLLSACAAGQSGGGGGSTTQITNEQLRELDPEGLTALQVVERFRPNWLRDRGTATFGAGGASNPLRVVVDGAPFGDLGDLASIRANEVQGLEFLSASDATTRFGTGYTGGAILVRTR